MISELIPKSSLGLVKYSGSQLIDRLGKDIIAKVVQSVLSGENIRSLTEGLTQRRVLLMNAALFVTYLKALSSYDNFENQMSEIINNELKQDKKSKDQKPLSQNEKQYLYWFLGLTLKSIQNVARGSDGITEYLTGLDRNLSDIAKDVESLYGNLDLSISLEGQTISIKWPSLLRCMLAIGSQTLTIRGSEKSMYGKLFEKFILGSVLTILGGTLINKNETTKNKMAFWLSDREDRRESDATFILMPGYGISFDIGFIGKGNSEISLDKITRFESQMLRGQRKLLMTTIILIDTIGENSRTQKLAQEIGGYVIQMSGTYWVYELAQILKKEYEFYDNPLLHLTKEQSLIYIKDKITEIDLASFVSTKLATEFDTETDD